MYRCPFCHSTNIEQERDYNELKIELKEIMKENEKDMPLELKQILNEAIVYDLYNDEQYLKISSFMEWHYFAMIVVIFLKSMM